ncbi:MAG: hypothetical protein RLZZ345_1000, partial [Actinomycetota bacterium]
MNEDNLINRLKKADPANESPLSGELIEGAIA